MTARTKAQNAGYVPGGGDKKIENRKLNWSTAQSKVGSLEKAAHKPGGGQVKIENRKLDWRVGARVGSTSNIKHRPGGGAVQVIVVGVLVLKLCPSSSDHQPEA